MKLLDLIFKRRRKRLQLQRVPLLAVYMKRYNAPRIYMKDECDAKRYQF